MKLPKALPKLLLGWYEQNKRMLPWRENRDPYRVWVSEIMLQQTRVEAVKGYYARFLEALPTVEALASCDDDRLHKLWEGLGYYSRVRNMKKCAIAIMEDHGGKFPQNHEAILALPGVGAYTAGAICSICFDMPTPAVDGNVLRVISRITSDFTPIDRPAYKKSVASALAEIYPSNAGDFTQALMELGATVCGPNRRPDCENCPCKEFCQGYLKNTAEQLPVKEPKRDRRKEEKTVFILSCDGQYALRKRPDRGLLAGLWEFPNVPQKLSAQAIVNQVEQYGLKTKDIKLQVERKHIFTHIEWDMCGAYVEVDACEGGFVWMTAEQLQTQAALPTAFRLFWEELKNDETH